MVDKEKHTGAIIVEKKNAKHTSKKVKSINQEYPTAWLQYVTKGYSVAPKIKIYIAETKPLKALFKVNKTSLLTFYVAPVIEE